MQTKDIPEPFLTRLTEARERLGSEVNDILDTAIETCPDWESAADSIHQCMQLFIDEATKVQNLLS